MNSEVLPRQRRKAHRPAPASVSGARVQAGTARLKCGAALGLLVPELLMGGHFGHSCDFFADQTAAEVQVGRLLQQPARVLISTQI